ncbi:MAG: hypothetical protein J6Z31_04350 [Fibrobacter sp.]|nr:hypothetical protein [Fibrobacter sp.]
MKLSAKIFALLLCALAFLACSDKVAGTATDTENTIAGTVTLSDGTARYGISVRQVAARTASSVEYLETQTDSTGVFAFDSSLADTVNFEFRYQKQDSSIAEAQVIRGVTPNKVDSLHVQLQGTAVLVGELEYTGNASIIAGSHFIILLDSTTFSVDVFAPDSFKLELPEGEYSLTVLPADTSVISKLKASGYKDSTLIRKIPVSVSAGDTLDVGKLRWDASDQEPTQVKVLQGYVKDENGNPAKGVSVHVVTDLYGFGVTDSAAFVTLGVTDSTGLWRVYAPVHDSIEDSFRVEFRTKDSSGRVLTGLSEYIQKEALEKASDTLKVKTVTLSESSNFLGSVFLVTDASTNSKQDTLCWAYSIRVGFRGTSHFKTVTSCNNIMMTNLPSDYQDLVFYTGDELVVRNLKSGAFDPKDYVKTVKVNLPPGDTLKYQGFTYTPPTTANGTFESEN